MIRKYSEILLLLVINCATAINEKIFLDAENQNQPFVMKKELATNSPDIDYSFFPLVPKWKDGKQLAFITEENMMVLACPSTLVAQEYRYSLFEGSKRECNWENFQPSINLKIRGKRYAEIHSIGYWLTWIEFKPGRFAKNPKFVRIFDVYLDENKKVLYTLHTIYRGPTINLDSWTPEERKQRFCSKFAVDKQDPNEFEIQFVPFEDFIPMPWKRTTLYDFNFFFASEKIKNYMETLNTFLRDYVNKTRIPLNVYSGVQDKAWYWKLVVKDKTAVLLVITNPDIANYEKPCTSQCENFDLQTLQEKISDLHCCELTEPLASKLKLVAIEKDSSFVYLRYINTMRFSNTQSAERSSSSESAEKHEMFNYTPAESSEDNPVPIIDTQ